MLLRTLILLAVIFLSACSTNKFMVTASLPLFKGGIVAINHESDLILAEAAMPPNIEMLEALLVLDPENIQLRSYGAQAYYGYTYGFVEDTDLERASNLYYRGFKHGLQALKLLGLNEPLEKISFERFEQFAATLEKESVPLIFWTASCWAKWIDLNRSSPSIVSQLPKTTVLMNRVLDLDESYHYGSVHIFFGVYYGSVPEMMGGNIKISQSHFDRARAINKAQLLMTDVLQAQYLERQRLNRAAFHTLLTRTINLKEPLLPELALVNAIARKKARLLLKKEDEWF